MTKRELKTAILDKLSRTEQIELCAEVLREVQGKCPHYWAFIDKDMTHKHYECIYCGDEKTEQHK